MQISLRCAFCRSRKWAVAIKQACLPALFCLFVLAQYTFANASGTNPDLPAFSFDGFDPGINRSISGRDTKEKLLQRFGPPRALELKKEPHRRDPTIDHVEVYTWQWDGLEIITYRPVLYPGYKSESQWIKQITLVSPDYKLKFKLSIGAPKRAFVVKLGNPSEESSKIIAYWTDYYASEGGADFASHPHVKISFDERNRATKIVWSYSAD